MFQTFYRMNSKPAIRHHARESGFQVEALTQCDFQPADYFDFNPVLFAVNFAAYRLGKLTRLERVIGASILCVLRRP